MISDKLLNPRNIVVVGGSDDISKAGGKVLRNLLAGCFKGDVYVVNPKTPYVQGLKAYADVSLLPETDMAILAVAARFCPAIVRTLAEEKGTGGLGLTTKTSPLKPPARRFFSTFPPALEISSDPPTTTIFLGFNNLSLIMFRI